MNNKNKDKKQKKNKIDIYQLLGVGGWNPYFYYNPFFRQFADNINKLFECLTITDNGHIVVLDDNGDLVLDVNEILQRGGGGVGPQGPKGDKGDKGDQGPKGDKGDKGENAKIGDILTDSNFLNILYELININTTPNNNQIYYVSSDKSIINPTNNDHILCFGAEIVNNYYNTSKNIGIITFDNDITKICEQESGGSGDAFSHNDKLITMYLPNSVQMIGQGAFYECHNLQKIVCNVRTIGAYAFCYTSISSIRENFPALTELKGRDNFKGCLNLTSLSGIHSNTIPPACFCDCTNLDAYIPINITKIGTDAFQNVPHIEYHGTATGAPWGALSMN